MFLWALKLKDCGAWYIWTTLPHTRLYVPFGGCKRGDFLLPWRHMRGIYTAFRLSLLFHIRSVHRRKQKHHIISFSFSNIVRCKFQHLSKSVCVKVLIFIICVYKIFKEVVSLAVLRHWFISFDQYIFVLRWLHRFDTYWASFSFFEKNHMRCFRGDF